MVQRLRNPEIANGAVLFVKSLAERTRRHELHWQLQGNSLISGFRSVLSQFTIEDDGAPRWTTFTVVAAYVDLLRLTAPTSPAEQTQLTDGADALFILALDSIQAE